MSPSHWTDEATPVDFDFDERDRLFLSPSDGLFVVDPNELVWQVEVRGYQVTEVPEDAVEWAPPPVAPRASRCEREGCKSIGKLHIHIDAREAEWLREED